MTGERGKDRERKKYQTEAKQFSVGHVIRSQSSL
jgi:hypothetical protein